MNRDRVTREPIEEDRYELQVGPTVRFSPTRRQFVAVAGAGIMITVSTRHLIGQDSARSFQQPSRQESRISQRILVGEDGTVTILTGKVEVGQGARTQISQATAEELGLPLDQIQLVMGDTELCPNDGGTFGSRTTPSTIPSVRAAAATAREVLYDLAAQHLQVDRGELEFRHGQFVHAPSAKSLSLAELAKNQELASRFESPVDSAAQVRRVDQWRVLGSSPKQIDARSVVTGAKSYPSDIRRVGMLYGKVLRPPVFGATLKSVDLQPARAMPGVVVVEDGEFVGCAAPSSQRAENAVRELSKTAQWNLPDPSTQTNSEDLYGYLKSHASPSGDGARGGGRGGRGGGRGGNTSRGSIEEGLAAATNKLQASYEIAYIQHAPMEPRAAVAEWEDGKLTVWTGTQNPTRVRGELMQAFRLPSEQVRVIVPDTGGGFGGKHTGEVALEAARLAKAAGRPVSLRWTREEEFSWAYFRPAGLIEVVAGLDEQGKIVAWDFSNYNSGSSSLGSPYEIPHVRCQSIRCDEPLRSGSYRALAATANTFARECFMDELAAAAGSDPLSFRLAHLAAGRLRDVLQSAAGKFQWTDRVKSTAAGSGVGIACGTEKGSYVAACAAVQVKDGAIQVTEVCQVYECGAIHHPVNLQNQVEGCLVMGLGGALSEEIQFADGKILNGRFSRYIVPRLYDLPQMQIVLIDRPDLPSVGAGETPIIAIAPAIAGAVHQATGVRLRSMPMRMDGRRKS